MICRTCGKKGHFQRACRSKKISSIDESPVQQDDSFYLGVVSDNKEPWSVTLRLNGRPTDFCIDTGAEVTVISEKSYTKIGSPNLKSLNKTLRGAGSNQLTCMGRFMGYLQKGNVTIKEEIYVIKNLHKPLLGRPACSVRWVLTCTELYLY